MKRALAIILSFAILLSSFMIVSVSVNADDKVLTLNQTKKVSIIVDDNLDDNSVVYTFTPTETAYYWFTSSGQSEFADPFAQVYTDSSCDYNSQIATGEDSTVNGYFNLNFNFCAYLTANETYYVKACAYIYGGVSADVLEYDLLVTKAVAPTGIEINKPSSSYGYVGNFEMLTYSVTPNNAMTAVSWSTSDDSIATVDEAGVVSFHKKGNVTITAKGAGFTDTITLEVKDAEGIDIYGDDIVAYAGEYFYFTYNLTPDKVKTDVEWTFGNESFFKVESTSSEFGQGFCNGTIDSSARGNTTVTVTTANGVTDTANVIIKELVETTGITVDSSMSVELGKYFSIDYTLTPSNSITSTTWTSSNPSVVSCEYAYPEDTYGKGSVGLQAVGAGKTTITVTTANGKTDTIEVTVVEPECTEITTVVDEDLTFENSSDTFYLKFIPEKSDLFVFEASNDAFNSCATLYNGKMEELKSDDNSGIGYGFKLGLELKEGETYYLKVESINSIGTISITVRDADYPSEISVVTSILDDVRVGEQIVLQYSLLPTSSFADITWESDNLNIGNVLSNGTLIAVGEGTFNLTVRASFFHSSVGYTELEDTVEVTVKAPDATELKLEENVSVTTVEDKTELFKFVPEKTGNYVLYSNDESGLGATAVLRDSSMMNLQEKCMQRTDGNFALGTTLMAGETYYFEVSSDVAGTFDMWFVAAKAVEGITILNGSDIKAQVENRFELKYEFSPIGAYENLTWSSSNEDVAFVAGGYVEFWSQGKATITAETASGKQATINIDVVGNIDIEIGEGIDIEISPSDGFSTNTSWTVEFTVPYTGTYCIRTEGLSKFVASMVKQDDESLIPVDIAGSNFLVDFVKGERYVLSIHNNSEENLKDVFRMDLLGDVNSDGKVTLLDKTLLRRYLTSDSDTILYAADINGNGKADPLDSVFYSRYLADFYENGFHDVYGK